MNTIINLNYRGNFVPVKMVGDEPWVNLNAIGRPFGKEPNQWLKSTPAQEYVKAVELLGFKQTDENPSGEIELKKAISVVNGGKTPGIWASEMVALEFARWCDPAFQVWCNQQLRDLITKGEHKVDMKVESLKLKWDQTILMVYDGKKWGGRFIEFLRECERPKADKDPRQRYSDMMNRFFGSFTGKYEFKKDIIHKMRANFQSYKEEFLSRSKSKTILLDNALLIDVERELENIWARYEAHSRGQLIRQANKSTKDTTND
jgi:hypothetical protein